MAEGEDLGMFQDIPDSLLLEIFSYLRPRDLVSAAQTCTMWHRVALDESLWKLIVQQQFQIQGCLPPGRMSWRDEYKRMTRHVPLVKSEVKNDHRDEVLDVTFSHDGCLFCTTSKDSTVKVWQIGYPTKLLYRANMLNTHGWNLTQYSVFNKSDTLLCICGVKFPEEGPNIGVSRMGRGAVFRVLDFELLQTMNMDPPHLFCDWFDDSIVLSGYIPDSPGVIKIKAFPVKNRRKITSNLGPGPSLPSTEDLVEGEVVYTLPGNHNHTMNLLVANVPIAKCKDCACSHNDTNNLLFSNFVPEFVNNQKYQKPSVVFKKHKRSSTHESDTRPPRLHVISGYSDLDSSRCLMCGCSFVVEEKKDCLSHETEKVLIYVSGEHDQLTLHPINDLCKRLEYIQSTKDSTTQKQNGKNVMMKKGKMLHNRGHRGSGDFTAVPRYTDGKRRTSIDTIPSLPGEVPDSSGDKVSLEMVGHKLSMPNLSHLETPVLTPNFPNYYISGLTLSADHRLLYFNYRTKSEATDQEGYPVLSQELAIDVYNLQTQEHISGLPFCGQHMAYSRYPAWYICLDTSPDFIVSGSEDAHGYLWDKRYGCLLAKYAHEKGVVNGVAFSPMDQELLVTVADDGIINIWRSKDREYKLRRNCTKNKE
ncbi:hypothetical protein FSP39_016197 [Pinctada imbricata]|uniref:F-box domain-containing protein n=1 Tax=Pinctada imbricata TaxID=66713 RepID=A0AA88YBB7_PINIB|nr:hypothetical protein FSP39_016197 [Pinctada imbricata]